jgi:Rrf2 family protein
MPGLIHLPESTSIALHACLWLAEAGIDYRSSRKLAQELGFSYHHVAKVVLRLTRAGLVESASGKRGGIRLARPAKEISLLDVYEAGGGDPPIPHRCLLDPRVCAGRACAFGRLIETENKRLHAHMAKTTLSQLARTLDKTQMGATA